MRVERLVIGRIFKMLLNGVLPDRVHSKRPTHRTHGDPSNPAPDCVPTSRAAPIQLTLRHTLIVSVLYPIIGMDTIESSKLSFLRVWDHQCVSVLR